MVISCNVKFADPYGHINSWPNLGTVNAFSLNMGLFLSKLCHPKNLLSSCPKHFTLDSSVIKHLRSLSVSDDKKENACNLYTCRGRRGGLMVSALDSGASPSRGHCDVFVGKTLNSHSASLHPGV